MAQEGVDIHAWRANLRAPSEAATNEPPAQNQAPAQQQVPARNDAPPPGARRLHSPPTWNFDNAPADRVAASDAAMNAQAAEVAAGHQDENAIDFDTVVGEGMDAGLYEDLYSDEEKGVVESLINDIRLYRYLRARHEDFTFWIRHSHKNVTDVGLQIKARLELNRGGLPYYHINNHPAAEDEKESWRRLPSTYITPVMVPQQWSVFVKKFVDASAVEIALMAGVISAPLERLYSSTLDRIPEDDYPEDRETCEEMLYEDLQEDENFGSTEELKIETLISHARGTLQNLLQGLSNLLQDTAATRQQVLDALKICNRTDPNFKDRPLFEKNAVIHQLTVRALDDAVPIHINPLHNERLWSALAYTPNKPYLELLDTEMRRIAITRNTIARLLRVDLQVYDFPAQEDARRKRERRAYDDAGGVQLFDDALEPIIYPLPTNAEDEGPHGGHEDRIDPDQQDNLDHDQSMGGLSQHGNDDENLTQEQQYAGSVSDHSALDQQHGSAFNGEQNEPDDQQGGDDVMEYVDDQQVRHDENDENAFVPDFTIGAEFDMDDASEEEDDKLVYEVEDVHDLLVHLKSSKTPLDNLKEWSFRRGPGWAKSLISTERRTFGNTCFYLIDVVLDAGLYQGETQELQELQKLAEYRLAEALCVAHRDKTMAWVLSDNAFYVLMEFEERGLGWFRTEEGRIFLLDLLRTEVAWLRANTEPTDDEMLIETDHAESGPLLSIPHLPEFNYNDRVQGYAVLKAWSDALDEDWAIKLLAIDRSSLARVMRIISDMGAYMEEHNSDDIHDKQSFELARTLFMQTLQALTLDEKEDLFARGSDLSEDQLRSAVVSFLASAGQTLRDWKEETHMAEPTVDDADLIEEGGSPHEDVMIKQDDEEETFDEDDDIDAGRKARYAAGETRFDGTSITPEVLRSGDPFVKAPSLSPTPSPNRLKDPPIEQATTIAFQEDDLEPRDEEDRLSHRNKAFRTPSPDATPIILQQQDENGGETTSPSPPPAAATTNKQDEEAVETTVPSLLPAAATTNKQDEVPKPTTPPPQVAANPIGEKEDPPKTSASASPDLEKVISSSHASATSANPISKDRRTRETSSPLSDVKVRSLMVKLPISMPEKVESTVQPPDKGKGKEKKTDDPEEEDENAEEDDEEEDDDDIVLRPKFDDFILGTKLKAYLSKKKGSTTAIKGGQTSRWRAPFPKDYKEVSDIELVRTWVLSRPKEGNWLDGATFYELGHAMSHLRSIVRDRNLGGEDEALGEDAEEGAYEADEISLQMAVEQCTVEIMQKLDQAMALLPEGVAPTASDIGDFIEEEWFDQWMEKYGFDESTE